MTNLTQSSAALPEPHACIEHDSRRIYFFTPTKHVAWRAETLMTKEPDTIEWIAGFQQDEVLYDVGANVGMYTIWAAATRGARVFAFEPESQNYAILNTNVMMNRLDGQVSAYCVSIADRAGFDALYLSAFNAGGSCHTFGEAVDFKLQPFRQAFRQGSFAVTLDSLVYDHGFPAPEHIKIDVDGIEARIVQGARRLLQESRLKSLLIEINTNLEEHWEMIDLLLEHGFDYSGAQVERAQRKKGIFKGVGNYVFRR